MAYYSQPLKYRLAQCAFLFLSSALLVGGCGSLPGEPARDSTKALAKYADTTLGKAFAPLEKAHPHQSGYYLLDNGVDAFVARWMLVENAERTIDLQYYIYRFDIAGQMLCRKLIEAAQRGVRVRLLLDDMEIDGNDFNFAVLASHPNIQVRFFNPFAGRSGLGRLWSILVSFERVNQRMHNKIFAVDNQLAIIGGRNIADDYFSVQPSQYFADLDLLAAGPIVREASATFDEFWNSEFSVPVGTLVEKEPTEEDRGKLKRTLRKTWAEHESHAYRKRLRDSDFNRKVRSNTLGLVWAEGRVVYDKPQQIKRRQKGRDVNDQLTLLEGQLRAHLDNTDKELLLISPYLIPGDKGMVLFRTLRQRGVKLHILTNSLAATDVAAVYGAYADYRKPLLRLGIRLFELKPTARAGKGGQSGGYGTSVGATLHAKTMVFDRSEIFVGSMNLDPRSVYFNTELGLVVTSPELAGQIADHFEAVTSPQSSLRLSLHNDEDLLWTTQEKEKTVRYHRSPYVGRWDIFWSDLMELLTPNSLL